MRRILFLLLAALFCVSANAQSPQNAIDQNYIEITGYAKMEIAPDLIYINIVLKESDTKNRISIEEQERTMYKKLKELNINTQKQLTVNNMSSNFQKRQNIQQTRNFSLLVYNANVASEVFLTLESAGISNLSISKLDNSDMEKYRMQVKIDAIKNAKLSAVALASAIGQSIGGAIYIQENNYNYRPFPIMLTKYNASNTFETAAYEGDQAPQLEFKNLTLDGNVLVRFLLK